MSKRLFILITLVIISCDSDDNIVTCSSGVYDCANICDGDATEDNCGECDSDPDNDCIQDCTGEWGGLVDDCSITCSTPELPNDIIFINHLNNQEIELLYSLPAAIFGFQFDIYGISIDNDIIPGDTHNAGLTIVSSNFPDEGFVRIIGYHNFFENTDDLIYLTAGCGTLLSFSYEGNIIDIRNIIFGGYEGQNIPMMYYP